MGLHYFGSKDWLKKYVECLLPEDLEVLVSPFFGSGRVEYYVATQRPSVKVLGSDSFSPVANFHNAFQKDPAAVLSCLKRFVGKEVNRKKYDRLIQKIEDKKNDKFQVAAFFFVIMRNSYHGKFGSYYVNTPPLTERTLHKLHKHIAPNIRVKQANALSILSNLPAALDNPSMVLYLDPPYLRLHEAPNEIYYARKAQGDNQQFHEHLATILLLSKVPFIMSLNDTPDVRRMYRSCKIVIIQRTYRTTQCSKRGSELLILGPKPFWSDRLRSSRCSMKLISKN